MKVNFKKIFKISGITLLSILVLLVLLVLSLRLPAVQNFVKNRLVIYLEDKVKTKVSLDKVYIDFPSSLVMENLYLQGQDVDTLLFAKSLDVGLNIPNLLKNKADLTSIDVKTLRANVVRKKDGTFNFDYIINAFATTEKEADKESKPFIISLDKIDLKDISVSFIDLQAGNNINAYFKDFHTRVKTFDLEKNKYAIGDIFLDGLKLKLKQDLLEEVADNVEEKVDSLNQKKPMSVDLNKIKLTNFDIDYGDDRTKTFAKINFRELNTQINSLDLDKSKYDIDHLLLSGAKIQANLYLPANKNTASSEKNTSSNDAEELMELVLGKAVLDDVQVAYKNTAVAPTRQGMDFNHLNFSKLNLDLRDFKMLGSTFEGSVKSGEIAEGRGLNIQKVTTDFVYNDTQAYLKNLYLQTPKTILRDELILSYASAQQLAANPGEVEIVANIKNSKIGFSDILNLVPTLRTTAPFNKYPNAILNVNTRLKGKINNLQIANLELSGIDRLKVAASGTVRNAMNPDRLYYDLKVRELSSDSKTIYNLVPRNTIPSNITLPSFMSVKGTAKGTTKQVNTNLNLKSTLGNAVVQAIVDMRQKNRETYNVKANLQNLQVGKIIGNKEVGSITGQIAAKGQSFDFKNGNASLTGHINSMGYNKYQYSNVDVKGSLNRGVYDVHLNSKDPNARLNLVASGVYNETKPTVKVKGSVFKLDLHKLGFYKEPMIIAGNLDGDFSNLDPDALNGHLYLTSFALSNTKDVFPMQEVILEATSTADRNALILKSQVADLQLEGKYKLTQIFGALASTINQYYQFQKPDPSVKIAPGQYFTLNAQIKNDDLIRRFVPDLKSFETITLTGNFNADSRQLEVHGQIPQLTYGANTIDNAVLDITNSTEALQYQLSAASLKSESFALNKINAQGDVANNIIRYDITTKDEKDVTQFLVAGQAKSMNDITEISLNPDGLKLNYDNWQVGEGNKIQIGSKGIWADNFRLSNNGSEIALQSETTAPNSPLNVTIKDFKIETITELIKKDTLLAKGTINGTAQIRDLQKNMTFNSDLAVTDLIVFGNPVGNLDAKVKNTSPTTINADVNLTGNNNDVRLFGDYQTTNSSFDLDLKINRLEMKTAQAFSMNAIQKAEGYLSGDLDINGTVEKPSILGKLKFNDVGLAITETGSNFKNINDVIDFTNRGIELNRFKINDADGNSLTLDGQILTQDYRDYAFNLDAVARDFKVVNSEKNNDALMYGILAIDANLQIRGDLDLPKVDGRLAVTDNTDFTFVLPQSSPQLKEREGIVEFIDQDQIALQETVVADSIDSQTDIKGMDVNVNIELTKEAKLSIIIDKANGDFVKLQGEANLTGGIDPSGKTTLVGVYEVDQGAYELSVSMLKRKFDIQKGSTITWTGEPTTAQLDITAVYETEAAPIDLVQQQLGAKSSLELNMFKQRIPFKTLLILKGELLKPEIKFDITMEDDNPSVPTVVIDETKAKLDQLRNEETEMNKQVFALLLLNRFIGENPFQSQAGLSAGTIARQSVSSILSQQLNNLAADLISGVDINFGLDASEDYSTGERMNRTDLSVDISKKLLNDRLKVTVGSNFGIEGDARQNEQMTNIAGDISVDYSLSRDGRYMLRAYRKNEYQVALQGQIVETGVGFIITLDYDQFKEIFEKSKRNREYRRNRTQNSNK